LLAAGYGFGQGSIFLAQTWLLMHGQLLLLAQFGLHFAFALLGILTVEAGSLTILARHTAALDRGTESESAMWQTFWEISTFRSGLGILVVTAGITLSVTKFASPFSSAYALFAAPAFLVWSINAAGLLDGLRLSGISGLTASLAHAASALALLFLGTQDPAQAGAVLGAAFTAGYTLSVVIQFAALRMLGYKPIVVRPTAAGIRASARDGIVLLGATLPGQLYYRSQLLLSSTWLGPAPTALYIYVKQVTTAVTQLIGFLRRTEFPDLVQALARDRGPPATIISLAQRRSTRVSLVATLLLVAAGLVLTLARSELHATLGGYLAVFALTVTASTLYQTYSQGSAALGRYGKVSAGAILAAILGFGISATLTQALGVPSFAIADVVSSLAGAAWLLYTLRRR
jgi:hypothetical protein